MNAPKHIRTCLTALLLFDAVPAQTPQWTQLAPATSPSPRYGHAMAGSPQGSVMLFGGHNGASFLNDTWFYNATNNTWVQATSPVSPSPRRWAGLAWHDAAARFLLFGGDTQTGASGELWQWNGLNWSQLSSGPPARSGHAMAYDRTRQRLVVFGGFQLADTWEYGLGWTQRTNVGSAGARTFASMVYDQRRGRMFLQGGLLPNGSYDNRSWEYDGNAWTLRPDIYASYGLLGISMAYDDSRSRVVMFGGHYAPGLGVANTVEHDGATFLFRQAMTPPPRRYGAPAAFIPNFGTILFGGGGENGGILGDTVAYQVTPWASYAQSGPGCGGPTITTVNQRRPWLGETIVRRVSVQGLQLGVFATGIGGPNTSLAGIGMPGCVLGTSGEVLTPFLANGSPIDFTLVIPATPSLHGFRFRDQVALLQPGVNAAGIVVGPAMTGTCSDK
ncbi:MAG: kelch repeat-containing protein [Planctomycetes bacterium]|jgi:hypothetical protein|nr:kelch repeat-containing protein [Planctomycetota bacterium]